MSKSEKPKQIYNYDFLMTFCDENNITLRKDYKNLQVNRNTKIVAKCIIKECDKNMITKNFRNFNRCQNFGCDVHAKIFMSEKTKLLI